MLTSGFSLSLTFTHGLGLGLKRLRAIELKNNIKKLQREIVTEINKQFVLTAASSSFSLWFELAASTSAAALSSSNVKIIELQS